MKKIILKKSSGLEHRKHIGYRIDYNSELNTAQYEAVMHNNGPALVIAGAGTGKTRTLVYRVARLIEDGVVPESILLLTFTRKSSAEMLRRASILLDGRCEKVSGGTFHSFALKVLRKYSKQIGFDQSFNVLDQGDSEDTINLLRSKLKLGKSKKRFPRKRTLYNIISLSVNKRLTIEELVESDYPLYVDDTEEIEKIAMDYHAYKKTYNIMDYDDLLLYLLKLMKENKGVLKELNSRYKYLMVDEYQDTNRLQHEIVLQLAGPKSNVMAVGDDAQSIYAFRGAHYQNIMFYPESFEDCSVYKIEENYRSTQPVLNLTNEIIKSALFKYDKELFTRKTGGELPKVISAANERQQSEFVAQQVLELREEGIELEDIAVLCRSGFLTFDLEIELNRSNIPYQKFGGMKFMETSHVKDLLAYMRVIYNPMDAVSWQRALMLLDGVGPGTASKAVDEITGAKLLVNPGKTPDFKRGGNSIKDLINMLASLKSQRSSVAEKAETLANYYKPLLKDKHDDWQKRWKDIEMFITISERYTSMREFLSDMALEPPVESLAELSPESKEDEYLTLSTIHSAKGLEWKAVFVIWALEGRFPSSKAAENEDTLEEERRLFYVACTRAKSFLFISYPTNFFDWSTGFVLSEPSRFLDGIGEDIVEKYVLVEESDSEDENENDEDNPSMN